MNYLLSSIVYQLNFFLIPLIVTGNEWVVAARMSVSIAALYSQLLFELLGRVPLKISGRLIHTGSPNGTSYMITQS